MRHARICWAILVAVVVIVAGVPPLREQTAVQRRAATRRYVPPEFLIDPERVEECIRFVEKRYPEDPAMLTAAGCLTYVAGLRTTPEGALSSRSRYMMAALGLLKRGAEGGGGSTAWAAYVNALARDFRGYPRAGATGLDPTDPEQQAQAEKEAAARPMPEIPPEQTATPLLHALPEWEKADPENGLPIAMEAYVLYGLRQDSEALRKWEKAARLPIVSSHPVEAMRSVRGLFAGMGFSDAEAAFVSLGAVNSMFPSLAMVREGARVALYEGRTAMMQGRDQEAVRLWDATMDTGQHLAQSRDAVIDFLQGSALVAIGISPTWVWVSDNASGLSGGPIDKGRYFWGRQHAFYVDQVGQAADAARRDQVIRSRLQGMLLHKAIHELFPTTAALSLALSLPGMAFALAAQAGLLVLGFLAISLLGREKADAASRLRTGWNVAISLLMVAGITPGVLAALVATRWTRAAPHGALASWRGNLRKSLPLAAALSGMLYLACSIGAVYYQAKVARSLDVPEMTRLIRSVGPSWTNPVIPPDSWRAACPPARAGG
jgi:hypothetical protein